METNWDRIVSSVSIHCDDLATVMLPPPASNEKTVQLQLPDGWTALFLQPEKGRYVPLSEVYGTFAREPGTLTYVVVPFERTDLTRSEVRELYRLLVSGEDVRFAFGSLEVNSGLRGRLVSAIPTLLDDLNLQFPDKPANVQVPAWPGLLSRYEVGLADAEDSLEGLSTLPLPGDRGYEEYRQHLRQPNPLLRQGCLILSVFLILFAVLFINELNNG